MIKDKLRALIEKKENEPNRKKIENLVIFIVILIITIVIINVIWNEETDKNQEKTRVDNQNKKLASSIDEVQVNNNVEEDDTARKLEEILSNINGVGNVKVMLTYSQTSQTIPLYNQDSIEKNTEETDKQGGTRKVIEKDTKKEIIYKEENGQKVPITQSVISPKIEGAIITAEGAGDVTIKTNIIQAVEAVTGVVTHKIQVFEMSK